MINLTEKAKLILRDILNDALRQHQDFPDGAPAPGLRLMIEDDGASFALDYPQPGDEVIVNDGKWLLLVSREVCEMLGDSTIDIIQSPEGDQLSIQREIPSNGHAKRAA